MDTRSIDAGGATIATQSFGTPTDPAVVLNMGATASMLGWPDEVCHALAGQGLFVVRYDNRDAGLSTTYSPGAPPYAVEDMAADLMAVLDAYGVGRAHMVGMSLGGLIGQVAALSTPGRVATLTLIGSEPLGWDGGPLPHIAPAFMDHFATMAELDWSDADAVRAFLLGVERLARAQGTPSTRRAHGPTSRRSWRARPALPAPSTTAWCSSEATGRGGSAPSRSRCW